MEIWKTVRSFPNYQISNVGSIRNVKTGKILKVATNSYGYKLVCLSNKNKKQTSYIHRLVAEAFIAATADIKTSVVNHIDGDRSNNTIENLEWVSCVKNAFRATARVKTNEITNVLDMLEQMNVEQLNKVVTYCKHIVR